MGFLSPPSIIAILMALSVHEWAHGFAAFKLGDPTAKYEGRLTLNPIAHLDPMGTILFLLVGFGWGKPVPIDPRYFRHPKRDTAITAIAGPVSNLLIAFISFLGLAFLMSAQPHSIDALLSGDTSGPVWYQFLTQLFGASLFINLALMAFNLLPIAPLDGSKILHLFIPLRMENQYEEWMQRGPIILLILIVMERIVNFSIIGGWVEMIVMPVLFGFDVFSRVIGL